jgi:hypothetical protein
MMAAQWARTAASVWDIATDLPLLASLANVNRELVQCIQCSWGLLEGDSPWLRSGVSSDEYQMGRERHWTTTKREGGKESGWRQ